LTVCLHLKMEFRSCARGRQWCSTLHYHWWTASIKPKLLFSHSGLVSWGLPFLQFNTINGKYWSSYVQWRNLFSCIWDKVFRINFRCWKMSSYTPHVRRVACDDVTISRALFLYKIAFFCSVLVVNSKYSIQMIKHAIYSTSSKWQLSISTIWHK